MFKNLFGGTSGSSSSGGAKAGQTNTDSQKIEEILTRGVEEIFVRESLEAKLKSGRRLKVKLGFDPTGAKIHLGRAITLWKLRALQDLGHEIIFIVGDFTARIGDPSDKIEKRPMLTTDDIKKNLRTYKEQIGKIINLSGSNPAKFLFNSTWLAKLSFADVAELAESFSVQQMSNRRNFKERFEKGVEISLREFLYPLMQGYDSVAVKADIEIGGFDQLFNLKAGRIVQKHYGVHGGSREQDVQDVLTTKMLLGTDGRKMSTSWGNVINITDEPADMFGKIMSLRDDLIADYFLLCTKASAAELARVSARLGKSSGATGSENQPAENPRDVKIDLAKAIVALYHGEKAATQAAEKFASTFSEKKVPDDLPPIEAASGALLIDLVLSAGLVESKTEFRRLIQEGAITNTETGEQVTDSNFAVKTNTTFKIGKRRFAKVVVN
ncbi:MAG: tyrosine--tRNA ligase [Patescibacteria group bacterium]